MLSTAKWVSSALVAIVAAMGASHQASAATIASLGHASGAQCGANDVNDAGVAVGACRPGNTNGPTVAWIAVAGAEVSLAPLVAGHSCSASGITNGGRIAGACADANSVGFAVSWSASSPATTPVKLAPLPGLLGTGLLADVSSVATAYNQFGAIAGQSIAGNGTSTAVVWPAGSGTPVPVSARGDNCAAVDVRAQTVAGNPTVLLNCPSGSGTVVSRIATLNAFGVYVTSDLAKFSTATYCVAGPINASSQVVGKCVFPAPPFARAAVWFSTASSAAVLSLPNFPGDTVGQASTGLALNDGHHMVFRYRTSDGRSNAGYINLASGTPDFNVPIDLPALHPGTNVVATGLGANDLVLVMGVNDDEHGQAAVWDPATPTVLTPVPLYGGGTGNAVTSMSSSGSYAVGVAVDSGHVANAVVVTLP
ncbi:hypothetical protein BJI69_07560 [Luteibacter rhizovicinus DSM 16549]|uniref:Uncharacterized protein n=1 Tax=Luteibacter rhizovicinus DSM 16549 TaxID=1440763 RepID=A0A1L3ERT5_9GAMM|nr:hypothetical protein [Luteibacter rhizovicinus]APG03781.1 hypothetical protein BJI69_07560 [Luteibacter rhizovicinus DSM 16549]